VEGGEGHGPRKEFFIATSDNALRRWGPLRPSTPSSASGPPRRVSLEGNQISLVEACDADSEGVHAINSGRMISRCIEQARIGERIKLEIAGGAEIERTIRAIHGERIVVDAPYEDVAPSPIITRCWLQKPVLTLFEFHRGTGLHWFGAYANELDSGSHAQALRLLALAVANCCKISFSLPVIFFRLLLASDPSVALDDLQGFDDVLHGSLKKCLKMGQAQFNALLEAEGLPSSTRREEYIAEQVKSILMPKAIQEVRKGFWSLAQKASLQGIGAADLRQIVCPVESSHGEIDIRSIFKVVMEEEMSENKPFVDAFWSVIDDFSLEEKRSFLLFVTGLEAPPEAGTERLVIELPFSAFSTEEHVAMLKMLPQAHTCTNTLELPNYDEALRQSGLVAEDQISAELRRLLGEKLRLAIKETASYELDAIEAESVSPALRPPQANAAASGTGWRSDAGTELPREAREEKFRALAGLAKTDPESSAAASDTLAELAGDGSTLATLAGDYEHSPPSVYNEGSEQSSSASVLLVDERTATVHPAPEQSAATHEMDGLLEDPGLLNSFEFLQKQAATQIAPPPGKISHDIDTLIEELELDLAIPVAQAPLLTPKESLT